MKTTVGFVRSALRGLKNDTEIEFSVDGIKILPRKSTVGLNSNCKVDIEKIVELHKSGLSYREIGNYFGVTRQAIYDFLKKLKLSEEFKND